MHSPNEIHFIPTQNNPESKTQNQGQNKNMEKTNHFHTYPDPLRGRPDLVSTVLGELMCSSTRLLYVPFRKFSSIALLTMVESMNEEGILLDVVTEACKKTAIHFTILISA